MSRGFPLQDTGPGMNEMFHDLAVEQEDKRAAAAELTKLTKIVCEWDEKNKDQCRCSKSDLPVDGWCSGCVGVARTVIAAGYAVSSRTTTAEKP